MQLDCGMAGQPSEPKRDEAVLHAKMGAKQCGGIAVVGFKRSPNHNPPLSPLCSNGPQIDVLKSVRRQRANEWVRKWWETFLSLKFLCAQGVRGVC